MHHIWCTVILHFHTFFLILSLKYRFEIFVQSTYFIVCNFSFGSRSRHAWLNDSANSQISHWTTVQWPLCISFAFGHAVAVSVFLTEKCLFIQFSWFVCSPRCVWYFSLQTNSFVYETHQNNIIKFMADLGCGQVLLYKDFRICLTTHFIVMYTAHCSKMGRLLLAVFLTASLVCTRAKDPGEYKSVIHEDVARKISEPLNKQ